MDTTQARRKLATYGKTNRRKVVHDLFDVGADFRTVARSTTTELRGSPDRASEEHFNNSSSFNSDESLTRTPSPSAQLDQELLLASSERFRYTPPNNRNLGTSYDVPSSDDETKGFAHKPVPLVKKRKITPKPRDRSTGNVVLRGPVVKKESRTRPNDRDGTRKLQPTLTAPTAMGDNKGHHYIRHDLPKTTTSSQLLGDEVGRITTAFDKPRMVERRARTPQEGLQGGDSAINGGELTLRNSVSARVQQSTPKVAKRPSPMTTSPSELGINTLRLTSEEMMMSAPRSLRSTPPTPGSVTPARPRRRLIDRLDALTSPGLSRNNSRVRESDQEEENEPMELVEMISGSVPNLSQEARDASNDHKVVTEAPQAVPQVTRSRPMYGKQRSHLSDMIDEVDILASNSQSTDVFSNSQTSHLSLQQDMFEQDDSDGPAAPEKLKSIHELRRAGASNRYDRDIELLLDDVDPTTSASKSSRIQGLLSLIQKLRDKSFCAHFAQSNHVRRLSESSSSTSDSVSSVLITFVLAMLLQTEKVSGTVLAQIHQSAQYTGTVLLREFRPLSAIFLDTKQNVSKAIFRDLLSFEQNMKEHNMLGDYQHPHLYAYLLGLRCLRQSLESLVELHEPPLVQPDVCLSIFALLEFQVEELNKGIAKAETLDTIQEGMLVLEMLCLRCPGAVLRSNVSWLRTLGQTLSAVTELQNCNDDSLQQSALRLIVSLSNDDAPVTKGFGSTALPEKVFALVDARLLRTAKIAEQGQDVDEAQINTVILALVSLLNMSELDANVRQHLSVSVAGSSSVVDKLVHMFNHLAAQATEAVTVAQSQVLVPFGYLSMLLCTLCLDSTARTKISQGIAGEGLQPLCEKAEMFYRHLQTVEINSDDKSSMSERFEMILSKIQRD